MKKPNYKALAEEYRKRYLAEQERASSLLYIYAIWQTRNPYDDPIIVDCKPISVPRSWCYVWEDNDGT